MPNSKSELPNKLKETTTKTKREEIENKEILKLPVNPEPKKLKSQSKLSNKDRNQRKPSKRKPPKEKAEEEVTEKDSNERIICINT
jgi:hypothetical protein